MGKKEQLQIIEEYAKLLFSYEEVALLANVDIIDITDISNQYYKQYQKGRLQTEIEIRESILDSARNGSPDAEQKAITLINELHTKNRKYD